MSIFIILLLVFGLSQILLGLARLLVGRARIRSRAWRWAVCGAVLAAYLALYQLNFGAWREPATPVRLTLRDALLAAPFLWWAASSLFAFVVAILFAIPLLARRHRASPEIPSPARRSFWNEPPPWPLARLLWPEHTACCTAAEPPGDDAGHPLPRLRAPSRDSAVCQLSDIHIGPFMPAEESAGTSPSPTRKDPT